MLTRTDIQSDGRRVPVQWVKVTWIKKETNKDDGGGVRVGVCLGNGHKDKKPNQPTNQPNNNNNNNNKDLTFCGAVGGGGGVGWGSLIQQRQWEGVSDSVETVEGGWGLTDSVETVEERGECQIQ